MVVNVASQEVLSTGQMLLMVFTSVGAVSIVKLVLVNTLVANNTALGCWLVRRSIGNEMEDFAEENAGRNDEADGEVTSGHVNVYIVDAMDADDANENCIMNIKLFQLLIKHSKSTAVFMLLLALISLKRYY